MIPANKRPLTKGAAIGAGVAAVVAVLVQFTPQWEGRKLVASRDAIGTGHPVDYCFGQTDEFGAVKVGQRFTPEQCDAKLAESLPKYINGVAKCLNREVPTKVLAALADGAYNAGIAAVCKSPMVRKINSGDLRGGCMAFQGWYVRSSGVVRKGLIARRSGVKGDHRKSEKELCLEGINDAALAR